MAMLEIAVQDVAGAQIAQQSGADRVELCAALGMGGLTPSLGTIEQVVATGLGVHVLIRPRGGGYVYSEAEIELMRMDITHAARAGVAGIVIGALTPGDASLDLPVLESLIAAAHAVDESIEITVHRCVDVLLENGMQVPELIEQLRAVGATRILTSGGAPVSGAGIQTLTQLHDYAQGNPQIQAGGGVKIDDIPALAGLDGVHLSARSQVTRGASGPGGGESAFDVTDSHLAALAVQTLHAASE